MDKNKIRETMLSLEADNFAASRERYLGYVSSAKLDRSEPVDTDEQSQAEFASDLSEAFDGPVHDHAEKLRILRGIDFGPKTEVAEGAVVKVGGRWFVVTVASDRFSCEGEELIGISKEAPIYQAMAGKVAGDTFTFKRQILLVDDIK